MKHKTRENIIIYGSLILAIVLVVYVAKTYYDNRDNSAEVFRELNEVFNKEEVEIQPEKKEEIEPDKIRFIDKKPIINKYFDDILNRKIRDDLLTYDKVFSWGNFEIQEIEYFKAITETYYAYSVNIKISDKNADVSGLLNEKLSTNDYNIVTVKFYFVYDNEVLTVKNVEI